MADMLSATGLVVCNRGSSMTFKRGTIIDLTIATPRTAQKMSKWAVLDEESLSDHFYLSFEINTGSPREVITRTPKIDLQKLKLSLEKCHLFPNGTDAEQKAESLTEKIQACRRPIHPGGNPRRSVHWWTPDINALRSTANHLRRVFQRKRKRLGPAASRAEELDAKSAKRELVLAIKRAKETAWRNLCDQVQRDPWGLPYKLIMGKLTRPPPIPELTVPGRLQKIIQGLFPQHPPRCESGFHQTPNHEPVHPIDNEELANAISKLKPNTSPGLDGIPNEAIKVIVSLNPDLLVSVYNTCLSSGVFPDTWKKARLVLLRKGDKPLDDPSSYRPLCLLNCLGKVLEKIIDNRLRRFLDENERLDNLVFEKAAPPSTRWKHSKPWLSEVTKKWEY